MKTSDKLPTYVHLEPGSDLPTLERVPPFKAVVVVEGDATPEWQSKFSEWLVRSGCRYMMSWGQSCENWHDAVDEAQLAVFGKGEIPDDDFVMTTWHSDKLLEEVFEFSQFSTSHPSLELVRTYILHITPENKESELLKLFQGSVDIHN